MDGIAPKQPQVMKASEFKAKCLKLIDDVNRTGEEVVITKNGQPLAKLVPVVTPAPDPFGFMKGEIRILGDIVYFDSSEDWEVLRDDDPNPL